MNTERIRFIPYILGKKITTTPWSELSGGDVVAFGYPQLELLSP